MKEQIILEDEKEVEKMIEEWDKVMCSHCGKTISMLTASTINEGEAFICKNGSCYASRW